MSASRANLLTQVYHTCTLLSSETIVRLKADVELTRLGRSRFVAFCGVPGGYDGLDVGGEGA